MMSAIVESVKGNGGSFPAGIAVIIPAFDPDERLVEMIRRLCSMGAKDIIVMNDGSCENCMRRFSLVEKQFGVVVLSHPLNRGKGAALKTGMRYLLTNIPEVIGCVTADADGQHTPDDIARVALRLKENRECLILGSREFSGKKVPWKSCAGNKITSVVFRLQTGRCCADTQTGLRGIPVSFMKELLDVPGERYEYEMNVLLYAADKDVLFIAVPIQTVYIDQNRASHFRAVRDSALVYSGILKFGAASIICAIVDIGLFSLLVLTAFRGSVNVALYSSVVARLCSGVLNYCLNKFAVFGQRGNTKQSAVKYFILHFVIMVLSAGATQVCSVFPINLTVLKVLVDAALFIMSYTLQRKYVFVTSNEKWDKGKVGG